MRRMTLALLAAILAAWMWGTAVAAQLQPDRADIPEAIDKIFERWDRSNSAGCAVGVSHRGAVVYTKGYGMADLEHRVGIRPDTIFESGSVAKQFTAAAIILLALDGRLSLDDPVRKYVPELPNFGTPILIRHFLTHTSGLRDQWPMLELAGRPLARAVHTTDEILELVSGYRELNFKPGDEYLYNNTAFTLLSVVVERVSGRTFDDFCQERLFRPLGMKHSHWRTDFSEIVENRATAYRLVQNGEFRMHAPFTNVVGNGGLLSTVGDLLIWNANLDNPRVGGRAMVEELERRGQLNDGFVTEYARGLYVFDYRGVREVSGGGSTAGYQAFLARWPAERLSVAVLCNTTGTDPGAYAHQIADRLLADRLKPRPSVRMADVPTDTLKGLSGVYRERLTDAVLLVAYDEKARALRIDGSALVPTGPASFVALEGGRFFTVDSTEAGIVLRMTETDGGRSRPRVWEKELPFVPTPDQLATYVGDYVCDELGSLVYTFYVEDGTLKARARPGQRFTLIPVFRDAFLERGHTIRFTRGADGRVEGLRIYADRVRNLRFAKRF
jgi:CubicO group peptidase (beta-lactamase class C family)